MQRETNDRSRRQPPYQAAVGTKVLLLGAAAVLPAVAFACGSILFGALLLAASVAFSALLLMLTENPAVLLTALPAYVFCVLLTGQYVLTLAVFLVPLAAFTLSSAIRRGDNKTPVTVNTAIAIGASGGILLCALLYRQTGEISIIACKEILNGYFSAFRTQLLNAAATLASADATGQAAQMFSVEAIDTFIMLFKRMLPALYINTAVAASYLCVSFSDGLSRILKCDGLFRCRPFGITMSPASAIVYTGAYIVTAVATSQNASIVALNLILMLSPGLFVYGWKQVTLWLKNMKKSGMRVMVLILLAGLLLFNPIVFATCVIMAAVWAVLFILPMQKKRDEQKK